MFVAGAAIDTNVLVPALVSDDAAQSARAVALMSEHEIFVAVTVMLELAWVHALSAGCVDFTTLDADLVRRARRDSKVVPVITRL